MGGAKGFAARHPGCMRGLRGALMEPRENVLRVGIRREYRVEARLNALIANEQCQALEETIPSASNVGNPKASVSRNSASLSTS